MYDGGQVGMVAVRAVAIFCSPLQVFFYTFCTHASLLQVVRYDPTNGSVVSSVKLPVSKVTSCCWGGKNFDELFVTSARYES